MRLASLCKECLSRCGSIWREQKRVSPDLECRRGFFTYSCFYLVHRISDLNSNENPLSSEEEESEQVTGYTDDFFHDWAELYHTQVKYYIQLQSSYQSFIQQNLQSFANFFQNYSTNTFGFSNALVPITPTQLWIPSYTTKWDCGFIENFNKLAQEYGLESIQQAQCMEETSLVSSRQLLFPCE